MPPPRAIYFQHLKAEIDLLTQVEQRIDSSDLGCKLLEIVKLRVSQINGCSFCVALHTARLRNLNESNERIDQVTVWAESPHFSDREQIALQWAESTTHLAGASGISDDVYTSTVAEFGEAGTAQLTLATGMINLWNRFGVAFQTDHQFVTQLLEQATRSLLESEN